MLGGSIQIEQRGANLIVYATADIAELGTRLLQLGVRFEHIAVNPITGKNRNVNAPIHLPGSIGLGGVDADIAEIGIEVESRVTACRRCPPRKFRGADPRQSRLIVGARTVSPLLVGVEGQRSQRLVRRLLSEHKLLARRQSDDSRQVQFHLGEIVAGHDKLLLTSLKFDPRAQRVNRRS